MNPKIHLVTDASGAVHLVRSLTKAGARKHVERKLGQSLHVKLPSQDELLAACSTRPSRTPLSRPVPAQRSNP